MCRWMECGAHGIFLQKGSFLEPCAKERRVRSQLVVPTLYLSLFSSPTPPIPFSLSFSLYIQYIPLSVPENSRFVPLLLDRRGLSLGLEQDFGSQKIRVRAQCETMVRGPGASALFCDSGAELLLLVKSC